jgi:hypothetical protein
MSEIEVGSRVQDLSGRGTVRYIDTDSGGRPTGAVKWDDGKFDVELLSNIELVPDTLMVELPRETVEALATWQWVSLGKYWNSVVVASIKALDEQ